MPRTPFRLALIAFGLLPTLALADMDGAAVDRVGQQDAPGAFTLLRDGPPPASDGAIGQMMPDSFYLGDGCDHVEPEGAPMV